MNKLLVCGVAIAIGCGSSKKAEPAPTTKAAVTAPVSSAAPASSAAAPAPAASAEIKSAKGIKNHDAVNPTTTFTAGEKAYVWSKIKGANGTNIRHVWKKDGKDVWTATLAVKSNDWRTHSRRTVTAGKWTVEVDAQDGTKLGDVSFDVTAAASPDAKAKDLGQAFAAAIQKKDKAALAKLLATNVSLSLLPDGLTEGQDAVAAALLDQAASAKKIDTCGTDFCTYQDSDVSISIADGKIDQISIGGDD